MIPIVVLVFILGYLAIAFEYPLRINKAAPAIVTGVICWTLYILSGIDSDIAVENLLHHLGEISSILFFLLGAMTIVEIIDNHGGFKIITDKIKTRSKVSLLWIITILTFFLSSLLDNLTTAIVMTSLISKLLKEKDDRLWFTSMVIIAANAGGAFSPLGDVTTTMLWIGGQISALNIIIKLFLPSCIVAIVPALIISLKFKNQTFNYNNTAVAEAEVYQKESRFILTLGILLLLFVPFFKTVTHLPPFMGMLLSLGILWIVISVLHYNKKPEIKLKLTAAHSLSKIDTPSILFFLGILLAVSALEVFGLLKDLAVTLTDLLGNENLIVIALGLISALIDNVPLVAAAQGMYDLNTFGTDHNFWTLLALTTGTGGSVIIIGSAAGVAAMGIQKIDFIWYLKKISLIALAGFVAGILFFFLQTLVI